MNTGYRGSIGRNEMFTPPTYALTQSIVNDALSDLDINNNSSDLFQLTVDGAATTMAEVTSTESNVYIQPTLDVPIKAKNFKITATDEEVVADSQNACSVKIVRGFIDEIDHNLLTNYMTETECDSKYLTKNNWSGSYTDPSTVGYSKTEADEQFATQSTVNTINNNLTNNYYDKTTADSTFATQSTVNTINNNLTNNYYTKTQVDEAIADVGAITEEELKEKLEPYATKEWVEAAISSGGDIGPMIDSETGFYSTYKLEGDVDFTASPTTTYTTLYDRARANQYQTGYKSSWFLQSAKFRVRAYNSETDAYDTDLNEAYVKNYLDFSMRIGRSTNEGYIYENIGLMVLFEEYDQVYKYWLKGIAQTSNDPGVFSIDFQVTRKPEGINVPDKLLIAFETTQPYDDVEHPYVRIIKEINDEGYVTKTQADSTYLSQISAQSTYATKTYVTDAISNIPSGGMQNKTFEIATQASTVELATADTISIVKIDINCTITSDGTDITHNLDNYTFEIKDNSNNPVCTLNSIYEENSTLLTGSYSAVISSSNNTISLSIAAPTVEEVIVLTPVDVNLGTVTQVISGYISKSYADGHYASKDSPTTVNITSIDNSSHTTNKTTYDMGPDFTIKFDSLIGITVKLKNKNPVVQMATAALTNVLQFGLNQITSSITSNANEVTASANTYESDIYNVIGTSQIAALTDFATWVSNYDRYSGTTLNNFLITAAATEQRYLKVGSLTNYYTKTETDTAISTAIANIPTPTIGKLEWDADGFTYKLEPETITSQGDTVTMLNFKNGSTTLARITSSPTELNDTSNIHAGYISPKVGIEFGKNIDGTSQRTQWSATLTNVANDNYDATTYSSADLDTVVPSVKFLNTLHYTKTQVDNAITTHIGALSNTYVTKTNPGTLNGNLTVNGEIYTSSVTTTGDINLTQGAVLDASGDGQFGGNLTVDGQTTLNDDLEVNGNITVSSNAQFDDTVIIEGITTINNDCNVNGCFTLDGDLNIANSGALDVTGSSTFHYDVTCNDILTVDATLYTNDFVSTGIVEFRTNDIIIGTNGNTITVNKAFFDSILSRLHALDGQ